MPLRDERYSDNEHDSEMPIARKRAVEASEELK